MNELVGRLFAAFGIRSVPKRTKLVKPSVALEAGSGGAHGTNVHRQSGAVSINVSRGTWLPPGTYWRDVEIADPELDELLGEYLPARRAGKA